MYDLVLAQLRQSVPFAAHVGVQLESLGPEHGQAHLKEAPERLNHVGTLHAGALFTLAEAASGAALAGALAPVLMTVRPVASKATITFLKPARGEVRAVGKLREDGAAVLARLAEVGKVVFAIDVTVTDSNDVTVAAVEVEWHVSARRTTA